MKPVFITGIGTGVGKTLISAIITEALHADYWKPVQAGSLDGTDSTEVKNLLTNASSVVHNEAYSLSLAASPHIAARQQSVTIDLAFIKQKYLEIKTNNQFLVIEGAGGLMVPLNDDEFVVDLLKELDAPVIIVSRNYLGSINHSLTTAAICRQHNLKVIGWVFNDDYMQYEQEIVRWSGYQAIASIPPLASITQQSVAAQAALIAPRLLQLMETNS